MPQFDLTTYSSQIFWFAICFLTLYICLAKILLPRINSIISQRKNVIDADNSAAKTLQSEIDELQKKKNEILTAANQKYKNALDIAQKNANQAKEKLVEEFKETSAQMVEKSRAEINKIISSSKEGSEKLANKLALDLQKKIM